MCAKLEEIQEKLAKLEEKVEKMQENPQRCRRSRSFSAKTRESLEFAQLSAKFSKFCKEIEEKIEKLSREAGKTRENEAISLKNNINSSNFAQKPRHQRKSSTASQLFSEIFSWNREKPDENANLPRKCEEIAKSEGNFVSFREFLLNLERFIRKLSKKSRQRSEIPRRK